MRYRVKHILFKYYKSNSALNFLQNFWITFTHINRLWSRINNLSSASAMGARFCVEPPTFEAIPSQDSHL